MYWTMIPSLQQKISDYKYCNALFIEHPRSHKYILVGWLVVFNMFNVPSTTRSLRDGTPIHCPM